MIEMSWAVNLGMVKSKELFGLIEYYDAVFNRIGLIKKEGEFRSNKLSLVLDLIRATDRSDNMGTDLMSTIIDAWRLHVPEKTLIQREEELYMILRNIKNIKSAVRNNIDCGNPKSELHLSVIVLSHLPITSSDFHSDDAQKVYDLIGQMAEQSLLLIEGKLDFSPKDAALKLVS